VSKGGKPVVSQFALRLVFHLAPLRKMRSWLLDLSRKGAETFPKTQRTTSD